MREAESGELGGWVDRAAGEGSVGGFSGDEGVFEGELPSIEELEQELENI